jgi:hypothetical protein
MEHCSTARRRAGVRANKCSKIPLSDLCGGWKQAHDALIRRPQERRIQTLLSITKGFRVLCGDGASLQGLIKVDGTFA